MHVFGSRTLGGSANAQGKVLKMTSGRVRGEEVTFALNEGSARRQFRGNVAGDGMQGTIDLGGGRTGRWTAKRT